MTQDRTGQGEPPRDVPTQDPAEPDATPARAPLPVAMPLKVARLPARGALPFDIRPDAAQMTHIAGLLGVTHLRKLGFKGRLEALPQGGWELVAHLGATVVQPCSVSLVPVTTRIDEPVLRRFLPDFPEPAEGESETPEDTDAEPLGAEIDPAAVMVEALALAVPPYPRAPGVELGEVIVSAPGVAPMTDADAHPMAGLAALRDRMKE